MSMTNPNERNAEQRPLYDTYQLAAAQPTPTKITLFVTPVGGTKDKNLTNLPRPYQLNPGDLFTMLALRLVFIGMALADIISFYQNYCVTFFRDGVPLLEAPPEFWPGGAGLAGFTTANATTQANSGVPDPRAVNVLNPPIIFTGESLIKVELNGTTFTTAAAVFFRNYLDGVWEKAAEG